MTEINGKGVPTNKTKGALGCIYTDTNTGATYKCTNAYIVNGVESYDWKRISEPNAEKIPVEKTEENKVETTKPSFEQFMNPPVEPEVIIEEPGTDVVEPPVENTRERVQHNGKNKYGKYYDKNKNHRN